MSGDAKLQGGVDYMVQCPSCVGIREGGVDHGIRCPT